MLIQRLRVNAQANLLLHFLALSPEDRRLRFGGPTSDDLIQRYVESLDPGCDVIFGMYGESRALAGVAHLALKPLASELGVSEAEIRAEVEKRRS